MKQFIDALKTNMRLKVYLILCAGLMGFHVYSAITGYKWFAGNDTAFSPGGPSGVNHK